MIGSHQKLSINHVNFELFNYLRNYRTNLTLNFEVSCLLIVCLLRDLKLMFLVFIKTMVIEYFYKIKCILCLLGLFRGNELF